MASSSHAGSPIQRTLILVASIGVSLALMEAAVRSVLPTPGFFPFDSDEIIGSKVSHPLLGFSYAPHFRGRRVTHDYEHDFTTNELGLRDRPIDQDASKETRLLAVGDSFTEGVGVQGEESWPARLEALLRSDSSRPKPVRVVNAGIASYNLRQIRLMAEQLVPQLRSSMLLVGVFVDGFGRLDHPYVFLNGTTVRQQDLPRLSPVPGGFLYSPFHRPWMVAIDFWLDQYWYVGAHLIKVLHNVTCMTRSTEESPLRKLTRSEAEDELSRLLRELDLMNRLAAEHGMPLVVLLINRQNPDGTFAINAATHNAVIARYGKQHGLYVVDPLAHLVTLSKGKPVFRFQRDGHWTAAAHEVAATEMACTVRELLSH